MYINRLSTIDIGTIDDLMVFPISTQTLTTRGTVIYLGKRAKTNKDLSKIKEIDLKKLFKI